jgi:hypothetical protein
MLARENVDAPPAHVLQEENTPAGCSKRPSSKAAGESKPEAYPPGYVEDFDEPRTKPGERCVLAHLGWAGENREFFCILTSNSCNIHHH